MKPGDEILIHAKLINVRQRDGEATVGLDSTTTVVAPLRSVVKSSAATSKRGGNTK